MKMKNIFILNLYIDLIWKGYFCYKISDVLNIFKLIVIDVVKKFYDKGFMENKLSR